jgi:hypothetical protein
MDASVSCETLVTIYLITRRHNTENHILNGYSSEALRTFILIVDCRVKQLHKNFVEYFCGSKLTL